MKSFTLLLCLSFPFLTNAQYGVLDNNFDADGSKLLEVSNYATRAFDVVVQPDGKILVAGWATSPAGPLMFVWRLFPDGSPDLSFGSSDGRSVIDINGTVEECYAMALQPDGKIVIAGGINNIEVGFLVVRLNATDGLVDNTFGNGGFTVVPFSSTSFAYDLAIQADGKILAAGITTEGLNVDAALARLNPDGSHDNSFSFDGKVVTSVNDDDWIQGLHVDANGKITVAGSTEPGIGQFNTLLMRYNSDGSLDNTFGINGIVETDMAPALDEFYNLTVDGAGSIFATGALYNGSTNMLLAKFNPDGSLDNSFSFNGYVDTDFSNDDDRGWDVIVQPDSKILVVGEARVPSNVFAMARYTPNGDLDPSFGTGGKVTTALGTFAEARAVALQSDLKILAAGIALSSGNKAAVARYTSGMNVGIGAVEAYIGSTLIYPNPITENMVIVEYELKSGETVSIELYDLAGKRIATLQPTLYQKAGSYQKRHSLPELSAGNYIMKLSTKKGSVSVKLTVN